MTKKMNLTIRQGETFTRIIRWETPPFIYKPISAITQEAPVSITVPAHGLVTGWRVAVVSAKGMRQINATNAPLRDSDFHQVTRIDVDTVEINDINSSDYSAHTAGTGYLQFYTPVDLTGYTARMTIRDRIGGTVLLTLTSEAPDNRIIIDAATKTITLDISAGDTDDLSFTKGVYDLEMVSSTGKVNTLFYGSVVVTKEVTAP